MSKRSQAAMEFLMTYGWAILVVLVVIGALAYFGVLNPARLLPDKCTATPGISCDDYVLSSIVDGDAVKIKLTNGLGKDIHIAGLDFSSSDATCSGESLMNSAGDQNLAGSSEPWKAGDFATFYTDCGNQPFSAGSKGKATITIKYYTGLDSTFVHELSVEVASTVQAAPLP